MSLLDKAEEVALALSETFTDCLDRILWELFVLNHKVVKVIAQIISTGRTTMAVEYSEEAYLRPLNIKVLLVLGLEDVEDNGHTVLVVVSDDSLIRVRGVGLDDAALLRACLCWLVVLELDRLWVERSGILSKEKCLYFDELNV